MIIGFGGRRIGGIEVKAGSTVTDADFRGLRKLAGATGANFSAGVVLYDGDIPLPFGKNMFAVPIASIWS